LANLRNHIEAAALCCNKPNMDQLLSRFDSWKIFLLDVPMPRGVDGRTQGETDGRYNFTRVYSNAGSSLAMYAHEYAHTIPDNVNMKENNPGDAFLPWEQRRFENQATRIEERLVKGQGICDLISGEMLQRDRNMGVPTTHPFWWYLNPFSR
jgi:hypothetical protein